MIGGYLCDLGVYVMYGYHTSQVYVANSMCTPVHAPNSQCTTGHNAGLRRLKIGNTCIIVMMKT